MTSNPNVGGFLGFVGVSTRTMHPHGAQYVQVGKRNRIDRYSMTHGLLDGSWQVPGAVPGVRGKGAGVEPDVLVRADVILSRADTFHLCRRQHPPITFAV